MVDIKVDKKRKKVDRQFRMTPKNDSQSDTPKAKDDTKNDTKNATLTDDLQEVDNDAMNTRDTKNETKKIKNETLCY